MNKYEDAIKQYCSSKNVKVTEKQVTKVMEMYEKNKSFREINRTIGITQSRHIINKIIGIKGYNNPITLGDYLKKSGHIYDRSTIINFMTRHFDLEEHESKFIYEIYRKNYVMSSNTLNIDRKYLCLEYIENKDKKQGEI